MANKYEKIYFSLKYLGELRTIRYKSLKLLKHCTFDPVNSLPRVYFKEMIYILYISYAFIYI